MKTSTVSKKLIKNSAHAFFVEHNGARHARLADLRSSGAIQTEEFNLLYQEEEDWINQNKIKYYPSLGWHFYE